MTIVYVATDANRLKAIEVDKETGDCVRTIQEINPIVPLTLDPVEPDVGGADEERYEMNTRGGKKAEGVSRWNLFSSFLNRPTTEWIERHPTFHLLYVFTSFGNIRSAVVTTYRILGIVDEDGNESSLEKESSPDKQNSRGRLKKLGSIETKGLHVSHVAFSPDYDPSIKNPPSTLCVGHYLDGSLSFFDCSKDAALCEARRIVALPELRPETSTTSFPNPLPSIHHVTYNPRPNSSGRDCLDENKRSGDDPCCRFLLVSDTSTQGRVWTFSVDSIGLPTSIKPVSYRKVTYFTPPAGWFTRLLTSSWIAGLADCRIRRCVVHPNGRYVYMLLELNTVIHVYEINPLTGRISGDCLQQIPAIDPDYFDGWKKITGVGVHASAELHVTETELFVSNRGFPVWKRGSSMESGVRVFTIIDDGAKLLPKQSIPCVGPVRHFVAYAGDKESVPSSPFRLFVGSDKGQGSKYQPLEENGENHNSASIVIFERKDPEATGGTFERIGAASVGFDTITCIVALGTA